MIDIDNFKNHFSMNVKQGITVLVIYSSAMSYPCITTSLSIHELPVIFYIYIFNNCLFLILN